MMICRPSSKAQQYSVDRCDIQAMHCLLLDVDRKERVSRILSVH